MLRFSILLAGFGLCQLIGAACEASLSINYSSVAGAEISFDGDTDTFTFLPTPGDDIEITSVTDGVGDSVGLTGVIDGTFTIGTITTVGPLQSAPVTGAGTLSIDDGTFSLTADLEFIKIESVGTTGLLNSSAVVNLSNIAYGGTVADLVALAAANNDQGFLTSTFQFIPGKSLTQLTADGTTSETSYSGSIAPVPELGSELVWTFGLLSGMVGLAYARRRQQ